MPINGNKKNFKGIGDFGRKYIKRELMMEDNITRNEMINNIFGFYLEGSCGEL